jgi:pyrroline-5-carboxylate reductase
MPGNDPMTSLAFIGGGNMAGALIGGLIARGTAPSSIRALEIDPDRRRQLEAQYGIGTLAAPDASLRTADTVILAVKPQQLRQVCAGLRPHLDAPLVLSIAAGIRAADIARWLYQPRVVRAMPNTPALIGMGISGVAALPAAGVDDRRRAQLLLEAAGPVVWLDDEALLDPVTAVSGSGPAYVFYFIEAMQRAGSELGLTPAQARELAIATFRGAAELAARSDESLATLRERVTSKGGTTAAALARMQADRLDDGIVAAVRAASERATELGDEFGRDSAA